MESKGPVRRAQEHSGRLLRMKFAPTNEIGRCILYIMKRTQLYLHETIWKALHVRSRQQRTTISELVRQAVSEKYGSSPKSRRDAMRAVVGIWKDRRDLRDSTQYVRRLRKGNRLRRVFS